MKFLVINLSGSLNESLVESLNSHFEALRKETLCILFDFENVSDLKEDVLDSFREVLSKVFNQNSKGLAFSNIKDEFKTKILGKTDAIPTFVDKSIAKNYLEKANSILDSSDTAAYPKVKSIGKKGDLFYINCPSCGIKLRIRSEGNHACPSCNQKFYYSEKDDSELVPPSLKTTNPSDKNSQYQMLSLD
jgi:rubrerythrin